MPLYVQRLTDTAILPTRGSEMAAGLDLYADEAVLIPPGSRALVSTGIAVALDPGTAGLIWPRSGLAVRSGLVVDSDVVDADYRGEVKVLLFNHSGELVTIQAGERIAQLLIQHIARPSMTEVDDFLEGFVESPVSTIRPTLL